MGFGFIQGAQDTGDLFGKGGQTDPNAPVVDTHSNFGGTSDFNNGLATGERGMWNQYANQGVAASQMDPALQHQMNAGASAENQSRQSQQNAMGLMWAQANGAQTPAERQAQATQQYAQNAQRAMLANAGGPQALAAARAQAATSGALQQSQNANAMNALGAQERQTGLQQYMGMADQARQGDLSMTNQNQDLAYNQAQLEMQRRQASDQMSLGYSGLDSQYEQAQMAGALGLSAANLQQLQSQYDAQNAAISAGIGAGASAAIGIGQYAGANGGNNGGYYDGGGGASIYHDDPYSDERLKTEHSGLMKSFLDTLAHSRATYEYIDPTDSPNPVHKGGRFAGVMAQDLEDVPELGHGLVYDTPHGKRVSTPAMVSALSAGLGELHDRVRRLEGGRVFDDE